MCQAVGHGLFENRVIFAKGVRMSYNLVERARKLAKLPAFTRNGVITTTGRVTQEQFADFVFQVGEVGKELGAEHDKLKDSYRELSDRCHALALKVHQLERQQWAEHVKNNVKVVAESIDLPANDTQKLVEAVAN